MLISISPEVIESLNKNEIEESVSNYLTSSLSQIIESNENMLVLRENPTAEDYYYHLLKNDRISARLREIISFLSKEYKHTSNMFEYVNRYVEITVNRTEWCEFNDKCILFLSLDYIYKNDIKLQLPMKILGENDSDSEFFRDLGELYKKSIVDSANNPMYYDTLKFKNRFRWWWDY